MSNSIESYEDNLTLYLNELRKNSKILTSSEQENLFKKIANNDIEAKNEVIERNLALVVYAAKRFMNRGLEFLDLIEEGNIGLMVAVERFDYTKDIRFSTYAYYIITSYIKRALAEKGRIIKYPVYIHNSYNKIYNTKINFKLNNGREPSISELASLTNINEEVIKNILKTSYEVISFNQFSDEIKDNEEFYNLLDVVPSDFDLNDIVERNILDESIIDIVNKLDEKAKKIIYMLYGFCDSKLNPSGKQHTLQEIGKEMTLTAEGVRYIKNKTLTKLKNNHLKDIYE